jgi:hypothetical protein
MVNDPVGDPPSMELDRWEFLVRDGSVLWQDGVCCLAVLIPWGSNSHDR